MPKKTVEEQIRDAAKKAGLTAGDVGGGPSAQKFGDGQLLKRLLDFLKLIGPILIPIIGAGEGQGQQQPGTRSADPDDE